jgi:hypothetical protein
MKRNQECMRLSCSERPALNMELVERAELFIKIMEHQ